MKKIFLPLLLLLTVFHIETKAQIEKPIKIRISINFDIASRRKDCDGGIGFCNPNGSVSFRTVKTGIFTEGNTVNMCIKRGDLKDELSDELAALSVFPVEESFELPNDVSEKLGYAEPIRIRQGNYRIYIKDDYYIIPCTMDM